MPHAAQFSDLPPVEAVTIQLDPSEPIMSIGRVSSIVGNLVIIESSPLPNANANANATSLASSSGSNNKNNTANSAIPRGPPALDIDTVLCTADRVPIGRVFDVFGPVLRPFYSVRYNDVKTELPAGYACLRSRRAVAHCC